MPPGPLSLGPAPSAFAQVRHAATRTAEASYRVRSDEKIVEIGGLRSKPWVTAYGEFGPVHGAGEFTDNLGAVPLRPGAGAARLGVLGAFPGFLGQVDPQGPLALPQSATDVRETGPASGTSAGPAVARLGRCRFVRFCG